MTTLQERSDLVVTAIRDNLPATIPLATRQKLSELMRRLIQVEIMRQAGVPDEAGNIPGIEVQ